MKSKIYGLKYLEKKQARTEIDGGKVFCTTHYEEFSGNPPSQDGEGGDVEIFGIVFG